MANQTLPHLNISTVDSKPYIYREVDGNKNFRWEGFLKDLMDEISRKVGFTYDFQVSSDGTYGSQSINGWNGIIGDVKNGKADLGAHLVVTPAREMAVDFTKPYMSDGTNLLVQKPSWFNLGLGYLVRPFASEFWIMLLIALLLIGLVFYLIGKFSPYEWGNVAADKDPRGAKNSFTLRNSYLFALTSLSWQGFREAPKSISGRIMAAFWLLFVLFTLIAYSSNLTAYFLSRPEQLPNLKFKTYEELLQSDISVLAHEFGSTQSLLRSSRSKTLNALLTKIESRGSFVSSDIEGIHRVKSTGRDYVFFMQTKSALYVASRAEECNLMVYGETLFPSSQAFAVKKGSGWKKLIDDAIEELRVTGFIDELKDRYWKYGGHCRNVDGRQYSEKGGLLSSMPVYPVTLKDMAVAILLLFLGFIASMVFLVVEILHYRVTKEGKKIEAPKVLSNIKVQRPRIFKPKSQSAKPAPSSDPEAGPSSEQDDGLETVPLEGLEESQPESSPSEEVQQEEPPKEEV